MLCASAIRSLVSMEDLTTSASKSQDGQRPYELIFGSYIIEQGGKNCKEVQKKSQGCFFGSFAPRSINVIFSVSC